MRSSYKFNRTVNHLTTFTIVRKNKLMIGEFLKRWKIKGKGTILSLIGLIMQSYCENDYILVLGFAFLLIMNSN